MWCDGESRLEPPPRQQTQPQQQQHPIPRRRRRQLHGSMRWQLWGPPLLLLLVGRPALGLPVGGTATDCGGGASSGGSDPVYDSVQARAVSAQFVLVGKVQAFVDAAAAPAGAGPASAAARTPAAASSLRSSSTAALVLVESVAKEAAGVGGIQPNAVIFVNGLTSPSAAGRKTPGGVGGAGVTAGGGGGGSPAVAAAPAAAAAAGCTTVVESSANYILFLNVSTVGDGRFVVVRAAAKYSRSDYTLVRDVTCAGCATRPIAKAKRLEQVEEGTADYKMACRADSRLLSAVDWYKDGVLVGAGSGVHLSEKKRKDSVTRTLRLKKVRQNDAGVYQCVARNALGNSTAVTRLVVLPRGSPSPAGSTTPRSPGLLETVATTVTTATDDLSSKSASSHYVDCPAKDMSFCLHGGRCRVRPNGNGRHCVCAAQYAGHRCEEKHVVVGTRPVSDDEDSEGVKNHVITALSTALGVLVLAVCLYCVFYASRRWAREKVYAEMQAASAVSSPLMRDDGFMPLSEVDGTRCETAVGRYTVIPFTDHGRQATAPRGDVHSPCMRPSSPASKIKRADFAEQGMLNNGPCHNSSPSIVVTAAAAAATVKQPTGKRHGLLGIFNPRGRLAATASSTDSLHHYSVAGGTSPAIRGNSKPVHVAMKSSPVGKSASKGFPRSDLPTGAHPSLHNAHPTSGVEEPMGSAAKQNAARRTGSLYEEPGAVDTSSAIHVNREKRKAICDTSQQGDRASRGSSYDTVDGLTVHSSGESTVLNESAAVLDALLDQLRSGS